MKQNLLPRAKFVEMSLFTDKMGIDSKSIDAHFLYYQRKPLTIQ